MRPEEGAISPAATLSKVDLPQPVGPTMATNSALPTASEVLATAVYAAPSLSRNATATSRNAIAGADTSALVPAAVHKRPLLDPRHHGAQLGADLLDRVRRHSGSHGLERGLIDAILQHPVMGEAAALDVGENALHLGA